MSTSDDDRNVEKFTEGREMDLPFREVAQVLGCSLNTALGRMHYAFRNPRRSLDD